MKSDFVIIRERFAIDELPVFDASEVNPKVSFSGRPFNHDSEFPACIHCVSVRRPKEESSLLFLEEFHFYVAKAKPTFRKLKCSGKVLHYFI